MPKLTQEERQARIMQVLDKHPGGRFHARDLARMASLGTGTIGADLDRLERAGLIRSAPSPAGRLYWQAGRP